MTEISQPSVPFPTQSSPLSTPPPSSDLLRPGSSNGQIPQYHPTTDLPFELAQHVQNYLDEGLFTQGFDFLTSIISNSIVPGNVSTAMLLPSPPHLALAATMTIHPSFTTRTSLGEKWNQANSALRLLRLILHTAGPVNGKFADAFHFTKYSQNDYSDSEDEGRPSTNFKTRYATTHSLFALADDFWSIVGWAFNCSCQPPDSMQFARWSHYELLLTFLVDFLETDWNLHNSTNTAEEALIWQFIELAAGGHGRARRIMRAIFADGTTKSTNEFRQIFRNELRLPKDENAKFTQRKAKVDIDKDEFGDYLALSHSEDSDSDQTNTTNTRPSKRARTSSRNNSRRTTPRTSNESLNTSYNTSDDNATQTTTLGPPSSLRLRLRLLHLLSHISSHPTLTSTSPTTFPDLDDLYTLFVEFIRPLPLPIYQSIILPSTSSDVLSMDASCTLIERILQRMLESAAPTEREEQYLTLRKFVVCYAPYAAGGRGGVQEQLRVSLGVEGLLRRCAQVGMLDSVRDGSVATIRPDVPTTDPDMSRDHSKDALDPESGDGSDPDIPSVSKQSLINAVDQGITRRERKAQDYIDRKLDRRRGKPSAATKDEDRLDDETWREIRASGVRMRNVLTVALGGRSWK